MYIYVITNLLSGKQYVGQTRQAIKKRFARHCWDSEHKKNMPVCLAIKKYGKTNFAVKKLQHCKTQEELDEAEIYWAKKLDTFSPNGYNLKAGAGPGAMSEETKQKIKMANIGKKFSLETRKRLSESHKGLKHSEETKRKLSAHNKGINPPKHVRIAAAKFHAKNYVIVSPTGDVVHVYDMKEFCQQNSLSRSKMSNVVTGKRSHHKGWRLYQI